VLCSGSGGQEVQKLLGVARQQDSTLREKKFNPTQPQMKKQIIITKLLYYT
jgi:hypothetical protein